MWWVCSYRARQPSLALAVGRGAAVQDCPQKEAQVGGLDDGLILEPHHQFLYRPIKNILKLSNGFTGHDAASLFGKV